MPRPRPLTTPARLRDVVAARTRVLLVGINPSLRSAAVGHHFAGPGNPFWRLLAAAGLVPAGFTHLDDRSLAELGFGLTNLCPRATRAASELTGPEIALGRAALRRKIRRLGPEAVVFIGLSLYQSFFDLRASGGAGAKPERIANGAGGARVFVVPNPSGLNASFPGFAHKLVWYRALADWLGEGSPDRAGRSGHPSGGTRPRPAAPEVSRGRASRS